MAVTSPEKLENVLLSVLNSEEIQSATSGIPAQFTVYPESSKQMCELVKLAVADGLTLIPMGSGSRINSAGEFDIAISTSKLNEQMEHSPADMVATIPTGTAFDAAQSALRKHHQRIALDPPVKDSSTIGGIVSTNDWGPLRHRYGTAKNSILATTIVNGDGKIVKAGAKVVKNVSGYDLNKLYIGARGSLGILLDVTFRLHPLPEQIQAGTIRCDSLDEALLAASTCSRLPLNVESVELTKSSDWEVTVTIAGNSETIKIVEESVAENVSWSGESGKSTAKQKVGIYYINASLPRSQLKLFLKSVSYFDSLSLWSLPNVGVCRLSFEDAVQLTRISASVESSGGFMEIEQQPANFHFPRWLITPPGLEWMRRIKSVLDPHEIFAPGILGEDL
jgi:glycolate oxidase FAD binding subunit